MSNKPKKREPLRRSPPAGRRKTPDAAGKAGAKLDFQDPHHVSAQRNSLELAIGHEVRDFRRKLNMTVAELATMAGMSTGMLSKIENGQTSPSLATLQELSKALVRRLGLNVEGGVLVAGVSGGGPADQAGLRVGDVVLRLDGKTTPSVDAVHKLLTREHIGRVVSLDVLRDGVVVKLNLQVLERPDERRSA